MNGGKSGSHILIPGLPEFFVEKSSLKEKVLSVRKFCFIYGEAGSGKTVFAVSLSNKNTIYIKIPDSGVRDIAFVYSYFLARTGTRLEKIAESALYDRKRNAILRFLLNKIAKRKNGLIVIIDDFQNLSSDSPVFEFIKEFFAYAPESAFFVFVSRSTPPAFVLRESDRGVFIEGKELYLQLKIFYRLPEKWELIMRIK